MQTYKYTASVEVNRSDSARWLQNHKIEVVVAATIALDWVPAYFSHGGLDFSFSRYVALPLIVYDFLRTPAKYFRFSYGWLLLTAVLVGTGVGVFVGTVSPTRLWSLLPSVAILFFYLKPRNVVDITWILRIVFVCSLFVPIVTILAWQGILVPSQLQEWQSLVRVLGGTNWSSLGIYSIFASASLGGILLLDRNRQGQWIVLVLGFVALVVGFVGILLSGQRASSVAFMLCAGLALLYFVLHSTRKTLPIRAMAVIALVIVVAIGEMHFSTGIADAFLYRIQRMDEGNNGGSIGDRSTQYSMFVDDLTTSFSMIPIGGDDFLARFGNVPHFIIGEAFYDGGILLLATFLYGFFLAIKSILSAFRSPFGRNSRDVLVAITLIFVGTIIQVSFHPSLNIRLFYLTLGLCLSIGSAVNRNA